MTKQLGLFILLSLAAAVAIVGGWYGMGALGLGAMAEAWAADRTYSVGVLTIVGASSWLVMGGLITGCSIAIRMATTGRHRYGPIHDRDAYWARLEIPVLHAIPFVTVIAVTTLVGSLRNLQLGIEAGDTPGGIVAALWVAQYGAGVLCVPLVSAALLKQCVKKIYALRVATEDKPTYILNG